jgi:hypothetical protein
MSIRYTLWMHREAKSVFWCTSRPVDRDGLVLSFTEEQRAHAECTRLNAGLGNPYARYNVEKELTARR